MSDEFNLTPEEKDGLSKLPKEHRVPSELQYKVINTLKVNDLISAKSRWHQGPFLRVAASIVLIALGYGAGWWQGAKSGAGTDAAKYVFMLHHDMAFLIQDVDFVHQYRTWMQDFSADNFAFGQELEMDSKFVRDQESDYGDDILSGFFLIEATSMADAEQIARTHPHFKLGGTIEIKKIIKN